jgi:hypothetical protein
MARRNAEALAEMRDSYGVKVSALRAEELRELSIPVQDQVAEKLGLQSLLEKIRAAGD